MNSPKGRLTVWIEARTHREVKLAAVRTGRRLQDVVDEALREWLAKGQFGRKGRR